MPIAAPLRDQANLQGVDARVTTRATADDFGASANAQAVGALRQGLDTAAETAVRVDSQINEADALDLDNQFSQFARTTLYDPESGYLNKQGRDALTARADAEKALQDRYNQLSQAARGPTSRQSFQRAANARLADAMTQVDTHYSTQATTYQNQQIEARISEAQNNAVAGYTDENLVKANVDTISGEVQRQAALAGWAPEVTAETIRQRASATWAAVISRMANDDPDKARQMLETRRAGMAATDITALDRQLHGVMLAQQARAKTDELMLQAHGSAERFQHLAGDIDNTELMDEVQRRGAAMFAQQEAARAVDVEHAQERALTAMARGGPDAVNAADRALLVAGNRWTPIMDNYLTSQTRPVAVQNLVSKTTGDRLEALAAANPEAFNIAINVARGGELGPGVTPDMIQNATGFSVDDLHGLRATLNGDDWTRVLNRFNGQSDNEAVDKAFRAVRAVAAPQASSLGIQIDGNRPEAQQMRGQFDAFLMAEARQIVATHHRQPTAAEIDDITHRAFSQARTFNFAFWTGQPAYTGPRAFQADPNTRVSINWDDIPEADQRALTAQWVQQHPHQQPTEKAIRTYGETIYADSLQRY